MACEVQELPLSDMRCDCLNFPLPQEVITFSFIPWCCKTHYYYCCEEKSLLYL